MAKLSRYDIRIFACASPLRFLSTLITVLCLVLAVELTITVFIDEDGPQINDNFHLTRVDFVADVCTSTMVSFHFHRFSTFSRFLKIRKLFQPFLFS